MSHYHHNRKNIRRFVFIGLFFCLFVIGFASLVIYDRKQDKIRSQELELISKQITQERMAEEKKRAELEQKDSFYQKLADGFNVNILIVGDSISSGTGSSTRQNAWTNLLVEEIEEKYNVSVNLTNISMGGATSYAGYVRVLTLESKKDFDLIIICFGQNDRYEDFDIYYEALIRSIKNRYPKTCLMSVLESSQQDYTDKIQVIQKIDEHYSIPVVDTIAPFMADYSSLVKDSVHPNDKGQKVYCDSVMYVINSLVERDRVHDIQYISALNDNVTAFETFKWFPVNSFEREGNTFTLNTKTKGTILGIDYNFVPGKNNCKIYIDGKEYAAPEVSFNYDSSQRHILVVNNWLENETVNINKEIKIVFPNDAKGKEQADGFNGIALSDK